MWMGSCDVGLLSELWCMRIPATHDITSPSLSNALCTGALLSFSLRRRLIPMPTDECFFSFSASVFLSLGTGAGLEACRGGTAGGPDATLVADSSRVKPGPRCGEIGLKGVCADTGRLNAFGRFFRPSRHDRIEPVSFSFLPVVTSEIVDVVYC